MRNLHQLQSAATTGETPEIEPQGTQIRPSRKESASAKERRQQQAQERKETRGDTWSRSGGCYHLVR